MIGEVLVNRQIGVERAALKHHAQARQCGAALARDLVTKLMSELTAELRSLRIGAFNFLLSDGQTTFAHRFGRSLFVLERGPADPVRELRSVDDGASIMTKWTARRQAVFIASERITDEPWREIDDGTLLRIERTPTPRIVAAPGATKRVA